MSYSIENAQRFQWSSVSGDLLIDRVMHLEKFLIGSKILEAGCGGGAYTHFLSEQGFEVTGVDLHLDFLQVAQEKDLKGTFIQADVLNLPLADNQFDSSFSFDVLEHVDDVLALKELARVTSQRIILTVPQQDEDIKKLGLAFTTYQDPTHLRYYTEDSLLNLCNLVNPKKVAIVKEGLVSGYAVADYFMEPLPPFTLKSIRPRIIYSYLARKFLKRSNFRNVNLGLAAIIDL